MKKLDNRGFSLIELMIAMAVAALIIGSVTIFIYQGTKNFQMVQQERDIQVEAQMLMGQLGDIILSGNYAEYEESEQCLTIYRIDEENRVISAKDVVWLDGSRKTLYLIHYPNSGQPDPHVSPVLTADKKNLFGEYVKEFQVKVEKEKLTVIITLESGGQSYSVENQVKMRNRYVEWPLPAVAGP